MHRRFTVNTNTETKRYIVSYEYVGPVSNNDDPPCEVYEIRTEPEHYNGGNRGICTEGWCGTTGDVAVRAHGEFDSYEEAEKALQAILDDLPEGYRELEIDDHDEFSGIERRVSVGDCEPYGYESTCDYLLNGCAEWDISAFTTNEQINSLVEETCTFARTEGIELDENACEKVFMDLREELQNDVKDELEEIADREPEEYWDFNHTFENEDGVVTFDSDPRDNVCDEIEESFHALPEHVKKQVEEFADSQYELAQELISLATRALKALDERPEVAKTMISDMIEAERVMWPDDGWTEGLKKAIRAKR